MSEIKRYRPEGGYDQGGLTYGCMEEDKDGEYVKWEDHEAVVRWLRDSAISTMLPLRDTRAIMRANKENDTMLAALDALEDRLINLFKQERT